MKAQWVCRVCGYNMIGKRPDVCPFCGEPHSVFLTWQEAEAAYRVTATRVNDHVTRLMSVPRLGLEHAAYRVETGTVPFGSIRRRRSTGTCRRWSTSSSPIPTSWGPATSTGSTGRPRCTCIG